MSFFYSKKKPETGVWIMAKTVAGWVEARIIERRKAMRRVKEIELELDDHGIVVVDTDYGVRWWVRDDMVAKNMLFFDTETET